MPEKRYCGIGTREQNNGLGICCLGFRRPKRSNGVPPVQSQNRLEGVLQSVVTRSVLRSGCKWVSV